MDNDGATWYAYNQRYWPTIYLIDKNGDIRYFHIGEGAYADTETAIQDLLRETYTPDNSSVSALRYVTPTKSINVRVGAGTAYDVIGSVAPGMAFVVLDEQPGWYQIRYNDGVGYLWGVRHAPKLQSTCLTIFLFGGMCVPSTHATVCVKTLQLFGEGYFMRGLKDKGVLITGDRGIGKATAQRFLEEGSRVICGLESDEVDATIHEFASLGWIQGVTCDVSREDDVTRMADEAEHALNGIDILIDNAGIAWEEPFLDMKVENWSKILDVNLRGMFLVAQAAARKMVARGKGGAAMVLMSSTSGFAQAKTNTRITMRPKAACCCWQRLSPSSWANMGFVSTACVRAIF